MESTEATANNPKCSTCGKAIVAGRDKSVSTAGGDYHVGCLRCDVCRAPLKGDFFLRGDRLVCRNELRVTNQLTD